MDAMPGGIETRAVRSGQRRVDRSRQHDNHGSLRRGKRGRQQMAQPLLRLRSRHIDRRDQRLDGVADTRIHPRKGGRRNDATVFAVPGSICLATEDDILKTMRSQAFDRGNAVRSLAADRRGPDFDASTVVA